MSRDFTCNKKNLKDVTNSHEYVLQTTLNKSSNLLTKHKWELHWVAPDHCKVWIWNLWILIDFNSERRLADDVRTSTIKSNTERKRHTSAHH